MTESSLDDPARLQEIRARVHGKPFLKLFYLDVYQRYQACIERSPVSGDIVELGSGGGFVKQVLPEVLTSDVIAYEGIDQIVDATAMPFADASLRTILMLNVFHHIPDAEAFLRECQRCLQPGGRVLIVDQHMGWISRPILQHLHHEACDPAAKDWKFQSTGPLSSANGAMAWMVFQRDRQRFEALFPGLELLGYRPHTPLSYWLAGGLKSWSLVPGFLYPLARSFDKALAWCCPNLGSFVDIELVCRKAG